MTVIDVTDADWQTEVIDRSATVPVVVDFWAEWCGPCRQLGPVLEKTTEAAGGKVVLAKLDTDANPRVAQQFQIQSIPAVKAFRDGAVVDEFIGAQPPAAVQRFFAKLVPSEADGLVATGDEASLRRALELEPGRADATVALARVLHARGDRDEALALLGRVVGSFQADGLAARIRLEEDPDAGEALAPSFAALDAQDPQAGLDGLLAALPDANGRKDDLRAVIVGVLDELGVAHPLARDARRRLASALY